MKFVEHSLDKAVKTGKHKWLLTNRDIALTKGVTEDYTNRCGRLQKS